MADDYAYRTVVDCVVGIRVEERRLKNGGREANLVGRRVVVGVHGLRAHEPFVLIDRFADLREHVVHLEDVRAAHVRPVRIVLDVEGGIVAPCVRITYLHTESGEFLLCAGFRFVAHPRQRLDSFAESRLQVAYHFEHFLFRRCGEVFLYVELAERFGKGAVCRVERAFPARLQLSRPDIARPKKSKLAFTKSSLR